MPTIAGTYGIALCLGSGNAAAGRTRIKARIGSGRFAIVDEFGTPQIHFARTEYDLQIADDERIALGLGSGQMMELQRSN